MYSVAKFEDVTMDRREFVTAVGSVIALSQFGCASSPTARAAGTRQLRRVGVQLYRLRDDARRNLERTIADIAAAGYKDVELLGSMNNFDMAPAVLRQVLDRNGLRAPSTHVGGNAVDDLPRQLDDAQILGHEYIVVASLPISGTPTLADYQRWADRLNEAGRITRERKIWMGFHNHAGDFAVPGAYDALVARTDPGVVRMQLDTGNLAMAGRDPIEYMRRFGDRYWLFHIKDVPQLGAKTDTELGKGVIDFRRLLASIDRIDEKHLFVEQETYPAAPLDSVRRDFNYISSLRF
jgi:sugar phosphate isomerase/epimerase